MSRLSPTILPISLEHIDSFQRCLDEVAKERRFLGLMHAPARERISAFVQRQIENGYPQFVLTTLSGVETEVVGWCDISPNSREGFRHVGELGMGVRADFRGQGFGRLLLGKTLEQAREIGLERIELEVYATNTAALSLYRKAGFEQEGIRRRARKTELGYDDVILMGLLFAETESGTQTDLKTVR